MEANVIRMQWTGDELVPAAGWKQIAKAKLKASEVYMVTAQRERSYRSHNHFFAVVHEAWMNLPEGSAEQFPTFHHLRKFALIKTGFYHSETFVMSTSSDAKRLATVLRQKDDFVIVTVTRCLVVRYTAKSQSEAEMGAKDFQASKQAVIDYLATLIGVTSEKLRAEAGQSA